eukprot:1143728-Pelagomonas_calceolata.AAC.1
MQGGPPAPPLLVYVFHKHLSTPAHFFIEDTFEHITATQVPEFLWASGGDVHAGGGSSAQSKELGQLGVLALLSLCLNQPTTPCLHESACLDKVRPYKAHVTAAPSPLYRDTTTTETIKTF